MNVKETQANNAANFSLFMVTFSQGLSANTKASIRARFENHLQGAKTHAVDYVSPDKTDWLFCPAGVSSKRQKAAGFIQKRLSFGKGIDEHEEKTL
jgi:hypothetical protein